MPVFKSCPVSLTNMSGCDTRNRGIIVWKRVPLASCPDHHNSLKKDQVITEKYKDRVHQTSVPYFCLNHNSILQNTNAVVNRSPPQKSQKAVFLKCYFLVDMFRSLYYRVSKKNSTLQDTIWVEILLDSIFWL